MSSRATAINSGNKCSNISNKLFRFINLLAVIIGLRNHISKCLGWENEGQIEKGTNPTRTEST